MKRISLSQIKTNVNRLVKKSKESGSPLSKTKARELLAKSYGYRNWNVFLLGAIKPNDNQSSIISNLRLLERNRHLLTQNQLNSVLDLYFSTNYSHLRVGDLELALSLPQGHLLSKHLTIESVFEPLTAMLQNCPAGYITANFDTADERLKELRETLPEHQQFRIPPQRYYNAKSIQSEYSIGTPLLIWDKGWRKETTNIVCYLGHGRVVESGPYFGKKICLTKILDNVIDLNELDMEHRRLYLTWSQIKSPITGKQTIHIHDWRDLAAPNSSPYHAVNEALLCKQNEYHSPSFDDYLDMAGDDPDIASFLYHKS
ncbi:hypothetical protein LRP52_28940 [Photobacterium sp. ZSDE20]|uniref:Glyoxalase superfamily protein n=1 Tax=Photobacterium pectinilyticum TaxID=2906793 RepID=A0ABT1N6T3_9GAMM|nr:glyoxalase superfamily protein [Photobacterium sp. ZSDE20]MCQ1060458.1 glyoxalase superfamily protein [Photobacterium sp. ZSDE20]MDD1826208.1 hypothetical protein [Photobacterium sp. ZSDE20]